MKVRMVLLALALTVVVVWSVESAAYAGSICRDGTWSRSEGRGTCSSHGGVAISGVPDPASTASPPVSATPSPTAAVVPSPTPTAAPTASPTSSPSPTPSPSVSVSATPVPSPTTPVIPVQVPAGAASTPGGSSFAGVAASIAVSEPTVVSPAGLAYKRSYFTLWTTQDGCSTRELVLIAEAFGGTRSGCSMTGATWLSAYDGVSTSNPGSFDIDHMVPLKEAWLSGAAAWSPARRTAFANDIGWDQSLIAVSARSNRQKSDRDPARWMPASAGYACAYVEVWVGVKFRWDLSMDPAERAVVDSVLAGCPADLVPLPSKAG